MSREVLCIGSALLLIASLPSICRPAIAGEWRELWSAVVQLTCALLVLPTMFAVIWSAAKLLAIKDQVINGRRGERND